MSNKIKLSIHLDGGRFTNSYIPIISPDGKYLIINENYFVSIRDINSNKFINYIEDSAKSIALTPNGKYLVTGNKCITIYNLDNGDNILNFAHVIQRKELRGRYYYCKFITHINISKDGKYIVSCNSGDEYHGGPSEIKLWDITNGKELISINTKRGDTNSLSISPDGNYILNGQDGEIYSVRNKHDVTREYYENINLYCIKTGKLLNTFEGRIAIFSPDSRTIICGKKNGSITILDLNSGKRIISLESHNKEITSITISPNGKTIISSSKDNDIKIWDISIGKLLKTFHINKDYLLSTTISFDGKKFAYGYKDIVEVYDIEKDKVLFSLNANLLNSVYNLAISLDGQTILCDTNKGLNLIESLSGKIQEIKTFNGDFNSIAVNNIKKHVISRGTESYNRGVLKAWNIKTGKSLELDKEYKGAIKYLSILVSSDGKKVIKGDGTYNSGIIKIKSITSRSKLLQSFKGHYSSINCLALSSSEKYIASGDDKTIKIWDTYTGVELKTFKKEVDYVYCLAFTPDEKFIVSGHEGRYIQSSNEGIIKIWNIATGKELLILKGHKSTISYILITQDGKRIVSKDNSSIIKIWDIGTGEELYSTKLDERFKDLKTICEIHNTIIQVRNKHNVIELFDVINNIVLMSYAYFMDGEWIIWNSNYEYNCSSNAYKYFCFVENIDNMSKVLPSNHPIYKKNKKSKIFRF